MSSSAAISSNRDSGIAWAKSRIRIPQLEASLKMKGTGSAKCRQLGKEHQQAVTLSQGTEYAGRRFEQHAAKYAHHCRLGQVERA